MVATKVILVFNGLLFSFQGSMPAAFGDLIILSFPFAVVNRFFKRTFEESFQVVHSGKSFCICTIRISIGTALVCTFFLLRPVPTTSNTISAYTRSVNTLCKIKCKRHLWPFAFLKHKGKIRKRT